MVAEYADFPGLKQIYGNPGDVEPVTELTTCPSTVCAAKATAASIDAMRLTRNRGLSYGTDSACSAR